MKGIIDRFEGDLAIVELENDKMININIKKLPSEAKEGSVIIIEDEIITIDKEETKKREEHIKKLLDDIFE
ncbi:protein of unknown function DUF3006 [Gottschalkia purinilytica]|uniref:Uncharacterized protein n=1 Tax=Gottschalkia purinilytica TaxID=1503 RepID=A0A0L0WET1_GOTPU|nr:DUF3006 domain-containing protein [Gottschalkia purinilytica]KNF09964.1 protein of unknown function DUF3006 [Gottschalkia purinilytica]